MNAATGAPVFARLDVAEPATAAAVLDLLRTAHAQEAALLHPAGAMPVLARTLAEVQASADIHLGAVHGDTLAGLLCVGRGDRPGELAINTLVVHPAWQRQGVARRLIEDAVARAPGAAWSVQVAEGNVPARALYARLGFVLRRRGRLQRDDGAELGMLQLHRPAGG